MKKEKQDRLTVLVVGIGLALSGCMAVTPPRVGSVDPIVTRELIDATHPGCAGNQYGFEGGDLHKIGETYHLVLNERVGELVTVNNRFGYWQSRDGTHWDRISTLLQFEVDTTGKTPNACIFSPKLVFSEAENRWCLFYIQFKSEPERTGADGWYKRYDGQVMFSASQRGGVDGIAGPYGIGRVVFHRSAESRWEGLQGITGFCPYRVNGAWYALYGSANTENRPCSAWRLGVASADRLDGEWTPVTGLPLDLPFRAEAPQVLKIKQRYFAVVDEIGQDENFHLLASADGQNWSPLSELSFLEQARWSWKELRTPIGLIQDGNRLKTLFTTYTQTTDFAPVREMTFELPAP